MYQLSHADNTVRHPAFQFDAYFSSWSVQASEASSFKFFFSAFLDASGMNIPCSLPLNIFFCPLYRDIQRKIVAEMRPWLLSIRVSTLEELGGELYFKTKISDGVSVSNDKHFSVRQGYNRQFSCLARWRGGESADAETLGQSLACFYKSARSAKPAFTYTLTHARLTTHLFQRNKSGAGQRFSRVTFGENWPRWK